MKFQTLCMSLLGAAALATALPVDTPAGPSDQICLPLDKVTELAQKYPELVDVLAGRENVPQPEKRQEQPPSVNKAVGDRKYFPSLYQMKMDADKAFS